METARANIVGRGRVPAIREVIEILWLSEEKKVKIINSLKPTRLLFVDQFHPVRDYREPVFRDNALRVELHALDLGVLFVFYGHDGFVLGPGGYFQFVGRKVFLRNYQ